MSDKSHNQAFHASGHVAEEVESPRITIELAHWDGNSASNSHSIDVSSWSPQQFDKLFTTIDAIDSASAPGKSQLYAVISSPKLLRFHFLHCLIGPDRIKSFYSSDTIRDYRRSLRGLGFDYPSRPSISGPGRGNRYKAV